MGEITDNLIDSLRAQIKHMEVEASCLYCGEYHGREVCTKLIADLARWKRWSTLDRAEDTFAPFDFADTKIRHDRACRDKTCDFQTLHHDREDLIEYVEFLLAEPWCDHVWSDPSKDAPPVTCTKCGTPKVINIDYLEQLLRDGYDLLRSASEICKRKGEATNWAAYRNRLNPVLERLHEYVYPLNAVDEPEIVGLSILDAVLPYPDDRNYRTLYYELIMNVANKFPGESRHDTAARYIQEREAAHTHSPDGSGEHGIECDCSTCNPN